MAKKKAKSAKKSAKAAKKSAKSTKKSVKSTKKASAKKSSAKKSAAVQKSAKKTSKAKKVASKKSAAQKTAVKKSAKPAAKKSTATKKTAAKPTKKATNPRSAPIAEAPAPKPRKSRNPSGLNARDVEMFRQMLLEKRAQLTGDVTALEDQAFHAGEQSGDNSRMPLHMADLGSDNFEAEFTLGLIEGERAVLREIEEALQRINEGTFGVCLATGNPIGKARLRAKPWAKYCYEYTLAQEKGQRPGY